MRRKLKGITLEEIRKLNKKYGGDKLKNGDVDTAMYLSKNKGLYIQIAYILRAILVGHPYTDGNKRTGFTAAVMMLKRNSVKLTAEQKNELAKQIGKIAKKNIDSVGTIARMIEYVITGN
ncbi:MAG: type II toxin-antitoxin system death-on-curing family toxin [Nanoarchaeota archaeon]|nr:type II toxin-antitoxin system death-on-curing family toxin [Nanoarchaeota archaeon]